MRDTVSVITINSRAFDGTVRKSWQAELIAARGSLLTFAGIFQTEISHPDIGIIRRGTLSYEYYWTDRWYNIFRFHEPEGTFRAFYCNINMPPVLSGTSLDYVDLDIDLLVRPDGSVDVLDEEEFAANAERFGYPPAIFAEVDKARRELVHLITERRFPFDHENATF